METIQTKEQWVLHRLERFQSNPANLERVRMILSGESRISLRLLDWLVTNQAKKQNVAQNTSNGRQVIVQLAQKSHLKAYSKRMFDPFCRWKHIHFQGLDTTVGQLNFFEWALQDEILEYLEQHQDAVHSDMEAASAVPEEGEKPSGRRKRHELSRSATKTMRLHEVPLKVSFT